MDAIANATADVTNQGVTNQISLENYEIIDLAAFDELYKQVNDDNDCGGADAVKPPHMPLPSAPGVAKDDVGDADAASVGGSRKRGGDVDSQDESVAAKAPRLGEKESASRASSPGERTGVCIFFCVCMLSSFVCCSFLCLMVACCLSMPSRLQVQNINNTELWPACSVCAFVCVG